MLDVLVNLMFFLESLIKVLGLAATVYWSQNLVDEHLNLEGSAKFEVLVTGLRSLVLFVHINFHKISAENKICDGADIEKNGQFSTDTCTNVRDGIDLPFVLLGLAVDANTKSQCSLISAKLSNRTMSDVVNVNNRSFVITSHNTPIVFFVVNLIYSKLYPIILIDI